MVTFWSLYQHRTSRFQNSQSRPRLARNTGGAALTESLLCTGDSTGLMTHLLWAQGFLQISNLKIVESVLIIPECQHSPGL